MRKNKIVLIFLAFAICILLFITGCNNKTTSEDTKTKAIQELDYLDSQIVSILNKLNNIVLQNYAISSEEISVEESSGGGSSSSSGSSNSGSTSSSESSGESSGEESSSQGGSGEKENGSSGQSGSDSGSQKNSITISQMQPKTVLESNENDIDWEKIKNEIEVINEAWAVVILDLSSLNVDNNDILTFSNTLDDSILSIKEENKKSTLTNMAKLYSFIPKFERGISSENGIQNVKQVKSYIINAYSLVEQDDWTNIQTNISESEKSFNNLTNDMEFIKDKEYKVNKTYVLIKELQNSLTYKDKKLFYVKYKNVMESINTL